MAESIKDEVAPDADDSVAQGFTAGAAEFLSELDVSLMREAFLTKDRNEPIPEAAARILCAFLRDKHSTDALELAGESLIRGVNKAATAIVFISGVAETDERLSWASFSLSILTAWFQDSQTKMMSLGA